MAKGYWIARIDIRDAENYRLYVEAARPAFAAHGARVLARGGAFHAVEGLARGRNVVIEFPSLDAAKACYDSPDYQAARAIRQRFADGEIVLVEGMAD